MPILNQRFCGKQVFALAVTLALPISFSLAHAGLALNPRDIKDELPNMESISKIPTEKVNPAFVDSLKKAVDFKDYEVATHLFTCKDNVWKEFGQALLSYKAKNLLRAEIISTDYHNGSVVVKQPDGRIRGHGGGFLGGIVLTIEPDSRTIRLPTGYSLVESDFLSLYDSLKNSLGSGCAGLVSKSGVNVKLFREPALVFQVGTNTEDKFHLKQLVYLNAASKLPMGWVIFTDDQPHALVLFEQFSPNKGLTDDLFRI